MKYLLALFFSLSLLTQTLANVVARANSNNVVEGDSFQLTITSDQQGTPDIDVLKTDFDVLGTSQSSNTSIINGNISHSLQWQITLSPKKIGELTIPAITVGKEKTQPIRITVIDASKAPKTQGAGKGINVTTRINGNGEQFYVFQEIPLTVRIEAQQNILQGQLIQPSIENAELAQSGQDRQSQIRQNGQVITVIERDYVLRPQQAGQLTIHPFVLKGEVPSGQQRQRDPFFNDPFFSRMQRGAPFMVRSNPLSLTVSGKTTAQSSNWFLPAKSVTLSADWQPENPVFKAGEAVTRIVRLNALGARAEQLPKLSIAPVDGIKIYIDNDQTGMRDTQNGTQAVREVTLSIVPEYGGTFTLPAISVDWQNTETNQAETAILAQESITVLGTPNTEANPPAKPKNNSHSAQKDTALNESDIEIPSNDTDKPPAIDWWSLMMGLLVAVAIFSSVWGLKYWLDNRPTNFEKQQLDNIKRRIKLALDNKDTQQLYAALLDWKNAGATFSDELQSAYQQLERNVYHSSQNTVDAKMAATIRQALNSKASRQMTNKTNTALPNLYRQATNKPLRC